MGRSETSARQWIWISSLMLITLWLCTCSAPEQGNAPLTQTPATPDSISADPLQGTWRLQKLTEMAPDGSEHAMKQVDGLLMFMKGHHSMVLIHSDEPRTPFLGQFTATDEERVSAFETSTANAGTYEISDGNLLTTHPIAAKNPGFTGGQGEYEFQIEGDALSLTALGLYMSTGVQTLPGPKTRLIKYEFARVK